MSKKMLIYDDVELLEVSPVGIPSYPDAVNRSLIKSMKSKMVEEEKETSEAQQEDQKDEEKELEKEESEKEPEKEPEKKPEKVEESSEKSTMVQMSKDNIQELISGIVKEVNADKKGLVEKQKKEKEKEDIEKMDAGSIAIKCGLFDVEKK